MILQNYCDNLNEKCRIQALLNIYKYQHEYYDLAYAEVYFAAVFHKYVMCYVYPFDDNSIMVVQKNFLKESFSFTPANCGNLLSLKVHLACFKIN